ncbi:hypothetical protein Pcinc_005076 [Petrolisthes cinctipes]|uniref:Uncharacterized protein n=1 Tax=Petrolisthes cinctipes TaxID=88211 RepID=A0AAE1KZP6_PETCI|nr:hypothetical protein Pcinc_005076 [Petrolisthes cinctipes]
MVRKAVSEERYTTVNSRPYHIHMMSGGVEGRSPLYPTSPPGHLSSSLPLDDGSEDDCQDSLLGYLEEPRPWYLIGYPQAEATTLDRSGTELAPSQLSVHEAEESIAQFMTLSPTVHLRSSPRLCPHHQPGAPLGVATKAGEPPPLASNLSPEGTTWEGSLRCVLQIHWTLLHSGPGMTCSSQPLKTRKTRSRTHGHQGDHGYHDQHS